MKQVVPIKDIVSSKMKLRKTNTLLKSKLNKSGGESRSNSTPLARKSKTIRDMSPLSK